MQAISIDKSAWVRDSEQQGNLDYDPKLHLYQMNMKDMATGFGSPLVSMVEKLLVSLRKESNFLSLLVFRSCYTKKILA
jgi:hypothetical protein